MDLDSIINEYKNKTKKSEAAYKKELDYVAGGVSANVKYFSPYPIFMKSGKGAWLTDIDNNKYVDYVLSYGPLILGHGREEIINSLTEHINEHSSWLYGTPHEMEYIFAEKIKEYYPSIDLIRYTNSGTEATLFSIRLAYAYTHKYKIAKFEGHYHGGYNQVLLSVSPDISKAGNVHHPTPVPASAGLPPTQTYETIILPFNDIEGCREILTPLKDEIAAVIMEPVIAGFIPAKKQFMKDLRALTTELGILLIIDEVKTGFRITMGGAQKYYDIEPDITCMGKVIGAGFPMGIVGGKKDIMMTTSPTLGGDILDLGGDKKTSPEDVLFHSGTYNGHPLILSAGLKTLEILKSELEPTIVQTSKLKKAITDFYAEHGIHIVTPGLGTMFNIAITDLDEITNYRDMQQSDAELRKKMDYALLVEGIYNKPGNRYNLSSAHTDDVIDFTIEAYKKAFNKIKM